MKRFEFKPKASSNGNHWIPVVQSFKKNVEFQINGQQIGHSIQWFSFNPVNELNADKIILSLSSSVDKVPIFLLKK